ncbi:MAG: ABC transporter permease [Acidimicrobiales bacterium]
MIRFLVRRVILGAIVMWVVASAVFIMYFVSPNDPAHLLAGKGATAATVAAINARLGLNKPLVDQYGSYLWRLLNGNLGYSYVNSEPVITIVRQDLTVTASLAVGAAILWLVIGVLAGVLAAVRPRSKADRAVTTFALTFYSMPTFLLGSLLLLLLFFRLHLAGVDIFPAGGYVGLSQSVGGWFQHMILPWITLALVSAAVYARLTRGSMLDVLGEDYVRTARAKGLPEGRVVFRHALRAAVTPMVTQFGIDLGTLLGGVIVTETIFGLPGLGQQIYNSITQEDLPVIIGIVLLASAFVVAANIVVDTLYALLDPRVRLH